MFFFSFSAICAQVLKWIPFLKCWISLKVLVHCNQFVPPCHNIRHNLSQTEIEKGEICKQGWIKRSLPQSLSSNSTQLTKGLSYVLNEVAHIYALIVHISAVRHPLYDVTHIYVHVPLDAVAYINGLLARPSRYLASSGLCCLYQWSSCSSPCCPALSGRCYLYQLFSYSLLYCPAFVSFCCRYLWYLVNHDTAQLPVYTVVAHIGVLLYFCSTSE